MNQSELSDSAPSEVSQPKKIKKAEHAYFRNLFKKYDENHDGYMELNELQEMVLNDKEVSRRLVKRILEISDTNGDGKLNYKEFVGMVRNEKFKNVFGRYVDNWVRFLIPRKRRQKVPTRRLRSLRTPMKEEEEEGEDSIDGLYEENYTFCPPPLGMLLISAFELACFVTDEMNRGSTGRSSRGVTAEVFIYDPHKRYEFWRFLTYMFVHIGHYHLVVNLGVQLILGLPLEMVHKWWRVLLVYFAGVIAGSLATSIADPTSYLAGASGGVYAIMTAHIATIIMNWSEMMMPQVILLLFLVLSITDVGSSIYNRYCLKIRDHIGYVAHFGGALAGLLVGIWILKNFVPSRKETYIWWYALVVYLLLMGVMVVLNFVLEDHWPK